MPIPNFTSGQPEDGESLGTSKVPVRNNLDGTFQVFSVDHTNQNAGSNQGYHTDIHAVPQGTWNSSARTGAPAPVAGIDQICALNWTPSFAGATADTQLFNITGAGGVSQLTGNDAAAQGWAWMGGILLQWGVVSSTLSTASVNFATRSAHAIVFPAAVWSVVCTPFVSGATNHVSEIYVQSLTTSGFTWYQADRASSQLGFYWIAVGQ